MSTTTTSPAARASRRWPAVVVALAAPLALALVLLAGTWDPADRLERVQAAVVNEDEPVTLDGEYTPLGRQLAGALTEGEGAAATYDWVVTDEEDATAGLADGRYAAAVTIPAGFSAAATSFAAPDGTPRQATVEVTTPDRSTAVDEVVAQAVTSTATQVLGRQLTTTYLENVLVGFSTLQEQLGAAADGATQLADGARSLADGTAQLADGATGLADGSAQLASGVDELGGGARQLAAGTGTLAGGARELASGAGASAAGARQLADGAAALAGGTGPLASGAAQVSAGLAQAAQQAAALPDGLGRLATGAGGVRDGLTQYRAGLEAGRDDLDAAIAAAGCATTPDADPCPALRSQRSALDEQIAAVTQIEAGAQQVAAGLDVAVHGAGTPQQPGVGALVGGLGQLATGAAGVASGAQQVDTGAQGLATGATQLADGLDALAGGARDLSGGAAQLATGSRTLASGVGALGAGADQLADGSTQLADGARAATGGATQVADGTTELGTGLGEAVEQLPVTPEDERAALADVVATPVAAPAAAVAAPLGPVSTLTAVALWVGALALFLAFLPLPRRVAGSTRSAVGTALGALALPAALGAVQGAVVGAVVGGLTGQGAGRTFGLAVVGLLAGVALTAFHQALAAWAGTAGRVLAVVAAFVLLVAGLAATVPAWVARTVDWLPLGAVADAVGGVVGDGSSTGGALVALVLWAAASLAATAGAVARTRASYGRRTVAALA